MVLLNSTLLDTPMLRRNNYQASCQLSASPQNIQNASSTSFIHFHLPLINQTSRDAIYRKPISSAPKVSTSADTSKLFQSHSMSDDHFILEQYENSDNDFNDLLPSIAFEGVSNDTAFNDTRKMDESNGFCTNPEVCIDFYTFDNTLLLSLSIVQRNSYTNILSVN